MEVSGQLHAPAALPPGKSPRYPFYRRLGGPQIKRCTQGNENAEIFPSVHRMQNTIFGVETSYRHCFHLHGRSISQLLACTLYPFYFCQIIRQRMSKIVLFVVGESQISHGSQNIACRPIYFTRNTK
jgi:hypothetical protein